MVCAQFNKSTSAASSSMGSPFGGNWAETSLFGTSGLRSPAALYLRSVSQTFGGFSKRWNLVRDGGSNSSIANKAIRRPRKQETKTTTPGSGTGHYLPRQAEPVCEILGTRPLDCNARN